MAIAMRSYSSSVSAGALAGAVEDIPPSSFAASRQCHHSVAMAPVSGSRRYAKPHPRSVSAGSCPIHAWASAGPTHRVITQRNVSSLVTPLNYDVIHVLFSMLSFVDPDENSASGGEPWILVQPSLDQDRPLVRTAYPLYTEDGTENIKETPHEKR